MQQPTTAMPIAQLPGHCSQNTAGRWVSSDMVLAELRNLVNARPNHHTANQIVAAIASGIARIECTTHADLDAAAEIPAAYGDQAFSLIDNETP